MPISAFELKVDASAALPLLRDGFRAAVRYCLRKTQAIREVVRCFFKSSKEAHSICSSYPWLPVLLDSCAIKHVLAVRL